MTPTLTPAAFTLLLATAVSSSLALANVPQAWLHGAASIDVQEAPAAEAAPEVVPYVRGRCGNCGTVEAVRRIEPGSGLPAIFEFTVRLRDGSVRTSHSASADHWRSGDRIMFMGGPATPAANQL